MKKDDPLEQNLEVLPTISVVVPSYNQGVFLEDCLLSILGQGYPHLEVFVMDAGSTDGSRQIIERFADRLTFWRSEKDDGQATAINEGFRRSTGQVLCWLNSDDMLLPGTLLYVGRRLAARASETALIYGACIDLYDVENKPSTHCELSQPFDAARLSYVDYIVQPSSFWTRALWTRVGELDASMHFVFDWEWFIRASKIIAFEYVPRPFSVYRRHASHKSGQGSENRVREVLSVVEEHASSYWLEVYREVARLFDSVRALALRMERWRIPFRRHLLVLFFPRAWRKLRYPGHFNVAAWMLI